MDLAYTLHVRSRLCCSAFFSFLRRFEINANIVTAGFHARLVRR